MTKVLLVEDDKSLREIYGVRLLAEGYDIVSAGDGEEALAMAIKEKPCSVRPARGHAIAHTGQFGFSESLLFCIRSKSY